MTALLPASPAACPITWKVAVLYPTLPLLAWEGGCQILDAKLALRKEPKCSMHLYNPYPY